MLEHLFDFIPEYQYKFVFYVFINIMSILAIWQCHTGQILKKSVIEFNASWGVWFTLLLTIYMGFRPRRREFGDSMNYLKFFDGLQYNHVPFHWEWSREWAFDNYTSFMAAYSNSSWYMFFLAALYLWTLAFACKRLFKIHYYIPLLTIYNMFSFWQYGVNGIRNGVASSIFIFALTYVDNIPVMVLLFWIAIGFHKSTMLLVVIAAIAWFVKNKYIYIWGWVLSIPASLIGGMRLQNMVANIGVISDDDRMSGYLSGSNQVGEIVQMRMEFRWDFVLFSALGIAFGYYFLFLRKYKDEYYQWLFNIYCAANAFWIIVIRATYSNRIAQLSWFILPIIMVYPFFKKRFWTDHEKYMGYGLIVMYLFTFFYDVVLYQFTYGTSLSGAFGQGHLIRD